MKSNTITLYRSYQKKGKWNYIDLRGEIIVTTISKIRVFSLFIENSDHKPPSDFGIGKQNSPTVKEEEPRPRRLYRRVFLNRMRNGTQAPLRIELHKTPKEDQKSEPSLSLLCSKEASSESNYKLQHIASKLSRLDDDVELAASMPLTKLHYQLTAANKSMSYLKALEKAA
ncbi:hypothetical protein C5167_035462 [Papaver somniferum]|uniref:Uncharacterized protein n=1 Tax=Papaver somniferum TaxID=3469 RepID=A0A4Y7KKA0_PAPSO|nr:hypothetical protein C5167_035462 [Papaver somniferum]